MLNGFGSPWPRAALRSPCLVHNSQTSILRRGVVLTEVQPIIPLGLNAVIALLAGFVFRFCARSLAPVRLVSMGCRGRRSKGRIKSYRRFPLLSLESPSRRTLLHNQLSSGNECLRFRRLLPAAVESDSQWNVCRPGLGSTKP